MIKQRPPSAAPVLQYVTEEPPFADRCFEASMALLTVRHWRDPLRGLEELRRVAPRRVVVTYDPAGHEVWLLERSCPTDEQARELFLGGNARRVFDLPSAPATAGAPEAELVG